MNQQGGEDACQSNVPFQSLLSEFGHAALHRSARPQEVRSDGGGQKDGP